MNLYLLSQDENNDYGTYDSIVVAAESEQEAVKIHPDGPEDSDRKPDFYGWTAKYRRTWCASPESVKVRFIGKAADDVMPGVVLSSFNAG